MLKVLESQRLYLRKFTLADAEKDKPAFHSSLNLLIERGCIMKKLLATALGLILLLGVAGCSRTESQNREIDWDFYNTRADALVSAMGDGDFEAAFAMFDEAMQQALPVNEMHDVWDMVTAQAGEFMSVYDIRNMFYEGHYFCFTTSRHENSGVTLRIVLAEDGLVAGLFVDGYPEL